MLSRACAQEPGAKTQRTPPRAAVARTPHAIGPADRQIELLHPPGHDYFRLLRSKLHWGRSGRSDDSEV